MRRVWVIEAPGKKEAFLRGLSGAGFGSDKVLATFGRLFDLPRNELGFDEKLISNPGLNTEIKWVAKRNEQIHKLIDLIAPAQQVVIATDSDLEGELIASQVENLCRIASKKTNRPLEVVRVHIHSFTPEHIKKAYEKRSSIDPNKVRAVKARRVLDRLLGYRLHGHDDPWRMSVGRVVSPLVHSLYQKPGEALVIRKKLDDGWNAIVRLNSTEADQAEAVVNILQSLPTPDIKVVQEESVRHATMPLTGPEAIKLCTRSLSISPGEIRQAIQKNYEKGRLSYPRSDSRSLDEVGLKWVSRMAANGAIGFDESLALVRQSERLDRSYDAHNAVLPTIHEIPDSSVPLSYLSTEEAVLRVIADHSMRIGEQEECFTRQHGEPSSAAASSRKWASMTKQWSKNLKFVKDIDEFSLVQDPLRHELMRAPDTSGLSVSCWRHSVSQIAMERLIEIGLGRPSTLLSLADKAFASYLDTNGKVNGRGKIMLEKVMTRLPELLNIDSAKELEAVVSDIQSDASIGARLMKAWEILKKNPVLMGDGDPVRHEFSEKKEDHTVIESPEDGFGQFM